MLVRVFSCSVLFRPQPHAGADAHDQGAGAWQRGRHHARLGCTAAEDAGGGAPWRAQAGSAGRHIGVCCGLWFAQLLDSDLWFCNTLNCPPDWASSSRTEVAGSLVCLALCRTLIESVLALARMAASNPLSSCTLQVPHPSPTVGGVLDRPSSGTPTTCTPAGNNETRTRVTYAWSYLELLRILLQCTRSRTSLVSLCTSQEETHATDSITFLS